MITLTTGLPGASKTLYTIAQIKEKAEQEGREVYYHGINDLMLPWIHLDDPKEWDNLPNGSIIVIDECQTVFRPRGTGSAVPPYIAALETHRHKGYDIFLITQHPMLVDQNIRRLVGQHLHIVRKFGMERSTVHQWGSVHEITQRNLMQAQKKLYVFCKEHFAFYKSAELHTHKRKIPKRVFFLAVAPVLVVLLGWYGYNKAAGLSKKPAEEAAIAAAPGQPSGPIKPGNKITMAEYYQLSEPRIPGLYHTAPKYDQVTTPKEAPFPAACLISKGFDRETGKSYEKCGCIDQQGNRYGATQSICKDVALNGIFKDFGEPKNEKNDLASRDAKQPARPDREQPFLDRQIQEGA